MGKNMSKIKEGYIITANLFILIHILWILFNCVSWVSWIMPLKCALKHKWCFISRKYGVWNRVICKSVNTFCPQHWIMPTCNTLTQFTKLKCVHTHKIQKNCNRKMGGGIFSLTNCTASCNTPLNIVYISLIFWNFIDYFLSLQCLSLFLEIHVIKLHFLALFMFLPLFRMSDTFDEINSKKKKSIFLLSTVLINIKTTTLCDSL